MPEHYARTLGSSVLVCPEASASSFADDLEASCADCGRRLRFRPYLADEAPKLCRPCFDARKDALGRRAANA